MIILNDTEKPNEKPYQIKLVDTHTHLGKEEVVKGKGKDYRIIKPSDHLDFYEKLKYDIYNRIKKYPDDFAYIPPNDPKLFGCPTTRLQEIIYKEKRSSQNIGWLADKIVTFPLHDVLYAKTDPHFMKSNNYILTRAQSFEYGSRFVPFCRVNPKNGSKAIDEIKRCVDFGARGLKLHPLSENWLEEICSDIVIDVVKTAIDNKLPVLIDCQNYRTAQDIHQLTMEVRKKAKDNNFTIIIGHCAFDYQTPGMFEILRDPNIKTETSGMRGDDCEVFYRNCLDLLENWHLVTMFGSDHNYFGVPQASDHILFLLSKKAKEMGITIDHIKHVLGINALRMLKIYWPTKVINREGISAAKVAWQDFDKIVNATNYQDLSRIISELCSISGVYYNADSLFDPSGKNVYNELFILNIFADLIDLRRSFVVQNGDEGLIRVSEITKLMDYATKITKILEEEDNFYPFTQQYLFDYLLHQKPK